MPCFCKPKPVLKFLVFCFKVFLYIESIVLVFSKWFIFKVRFLQFLNKCLSIKSVHARSPPIHRFNPRLIVRLCWLTAYSLTFTWFIGSYVLLFLVGAGKRGKIFFLITSKQKESKSFTDGSMSGVLEETHIQGCSEYRKRKWKFLSQKM